MKRSVVFFFILIGVSSVFGVMTAFLTTSEASQVSIIGDFTNYESVKMQQMNLLWRYMVDLEPGSYLYRFIVDGEVQLDFKNTDLGVYQEEVYNIRSVSERSQPQKGNSNISKVYFETSRQYINPVEKGEIYLTIGFDEGDVEDVVLQSNALECTKERFVHRKVAYYRFHIKTPAPILKYRFVIQDSEEFVFGYNASEEFFTFDFDNPLIDYMNIPQWSRGAIVYQIFPDRFKNGNTEIDLENTPDWTATPTGVQLSSSLYGGDLQGIIDSLDYLNFINVDSVYLNPIFQADSVHKYNTTDYLKMDPGFGEEDDFDLLVDQLHEYDIKLILDAVFNHTGTAFFAMEENFQKQGASDYLDWYFIQQFPIEESAYSYKTWQGYASLPKLNTENSQVRGYLAQVLGKWFAKSVDGWRLDTTDQYSKIFLSEFLYPTIMNIKSDSVLVGEYWDQALEYFNTDCMNSVMNYLFRDMTLTYVRGGSADSFITSSLNYLNLYPPQIIDGIWNMLGSHDTARFLTLLNKNVAAAKLAVVLQMTFKGSPMIYYGDEIGMTGETDPFCRKPFPWKNEKKWNSELFELYKALTALRSDSEALKKGTINFIYNTAGVLGFEREYEGETILVFTNSRSKDFDIDLKLDAVYKDVFRGEQLEYLGILEGKGYLILKGCE
ncbi:MAG: alpha-amylase family glycosyl hydrolase [Thermotogota bacterium]|nr:alpha-amylase family glycosyl hydrolase [Thermotogota bacterium]